MSLMRLAMRPPSGDESDRRNDGDGGRKGFLEFAKRYFGPRFAEPKPSGTARKSDWLATARGKSDALEARLRKAEGGSRK